MRIRIVQRLTTLSLVKIAGVVVRKRVKCSYNVDPHSGGGIKKVSIDEQQHTRKNNFSFSGDVLDMRCTFG